MEHSYSKDFHPKDNVEVMATKTILIPRPPQCPSCHQHGNDDILTVSSNKFLYNMLYNKYLVYRNSIINKMIHSLIKYHQQ